MLSFSECDTELALAAKEKEKCGERKGRKKKVGGVLEGVSGKGMRE